jgi:hypothetical protein
VDLNVEKSYLLKTLAMGLALILGPVFPLVLMDLDLSQKTLAGFVMAVGGVIAFNCWRFHKNPVRHRVDEEGIWIYKNLKLQKKFIPWDDVVSFEPFNSVLHYGPIPYRREQMIHIHVKSTSRHFRNGKNEKPLALDFMGIRESRGEVLEKMTMFQEQKTRPSGKDPAQATP